MTRELRTLKREQFEAVIKQLNLEDIICGLCGEKITKYNFVILAKGFFSCDNKVCLGVVLAEMELYDSEKGSKVLKERT